jgi:hypothetical protein
LVYLKVRVTWFDGGNLDQSRSRGNLLSLCSLLSSRSLSLGLPACASRHDIYCFEVDSYPVAAYANKRLHSDEGALPCSNKAQQSRAARLDTFGFKGLAPARLEGHLDSHRAEFGSAGFEVDSYPVAAYANKRLHSDEGALPCSNKAQHLSQLNPKRRPCGIKVVLAATCSRFALSSLPARCLWV